MNQIILGPGLKPEGADSGASLPVDAVDGQPSDGHIYIVNEALSLQMPLERQAHRAGQLALNPAMPLAERANQQAIIAVLQGRIAVMEQEGVSAPEAAELVPFPDHLTALIPGARAAAQAA